MARAHAVCIKSIASEAGNKQNGSITYPSRDALDECSRSRVQPLDIFKDQKNRVRFRKRCEPIIQGVERSPSRILW